MYKKNRPTAKAPEDYKLSCPLRAPPWAVEDFMGSLSRLRSPLDPGALKEECSHGEERDSVSK